MSLAFKLLVMSTESIPSPGSSSLNFCGKATKLKLTNISRRPGLPFVLNIVDHSFSQCVKMLAGLVSHLSKSCVAVALICTAVIHQVPSVGFHHLFTQDLILAVRVEHLSETDVYCQRKIMAEGYIKQG